MPPLLPPICNHRTLIACHHLNIAPPTFCRIQSIAPRGKVNPSPKWLPWRVRSQAFLGHPASRRHLQIIIIPCRPSLGIEKEDDRAPILPTALSPWALSVPLAHSHPHILTMVHNNCGHGTIKIEPPSHVRTLPKGMNHARHKRKCARLSSCTFEP